MARKCNVRKRKARQISPLERVIEAWDEHCVPLREDIDDAEGMLSDILDQIECGEATPNDIAAAVSDAVMALRDISRAFDKMSDQIMEAELTGVTDE